MNYEETLEYIYSTAPMFQQIGSSAYKEGMENSYAIDKHLNEPHKQYKTIHVGGTNGKGSTSHLLASVLQSAGYKVGLYTSPHLLDFRERIKVNGEMIEKDFIVSFTSRNKDFFTSIQPSFFELTTGMAFEYFAHKKVDIAIIEVGLGGRLDCTNVISPILSIITNVSFDHVNLLGNTLPAIANEKAGIIKKDIPAIVGEASGEVKDIFMPYHPLFADEQNIILSAQLLPNGHWQFETKEYLHLIGELGGFAQEKNAATVLCAVNELKKQELNIPAEAVYKGFASVIKNTGLLGRWQIVGQNPKTVLDTGHNIAGMEYIVNQLASEEYDKLHIVFGMVNDKDISAVLRILPKQAIYYFTQPDIPRALSAQELARQARQVGLEGKIFSSVKEAFSLAKTSASEKDFIFVGGSTFMVADALSILV